MKFIIDRSKWFRGQGMDDSRLLRDDGMMCCLGIICKQLGVKDEVLHNERTVENLVHAIPNELKDKYGRPQGWMGPAYMTNDNRHLEDSEREKRLKDFASVDGHDLEFIN